MAQQQGRAALYAAISTLKLPPLDASPTIWEHFTTEFRQVVEADGALNPYRRLQAEAVALAKEHAQRFPLDDEDLKALTIYVNATRLFYDCLQVAYTPERKGFEERIFLPAP